MTAIALVGWLLAWHMVRRLRLESREFGDMVDQAIATCRVANETNETLLGVCDTWERRAEQWRALALGSSYLGALEREAQFRALGE